MKKEITALRENKPDTKKRFRVALLIETSLSSGQDILMGIGRYAREHSNWSIYAQPHDLSQPPPKWFENWEGDGIIARLQNDHIVRAVKDKGVPVVDVLGVKYQQDTPLVHVDNRAIAALAAEHLLDRGFRDFAFFGLEKENWSVERQNGFREYLADRGFTNSELIMSRKMLDDTPWEKLVEQVSEWLQQLSLPVGIMLCSDVRGLLVQEACRKTGRVIGQSVALIGVGNDRTLCELSNPPLSSVEANHIEVGYNAAALLDSMMSGAPLSKMPDPVEPLFVGIRASTDFLAVDDAAVAKAMHYIRNHCDEPLRLDSIARYAGLSRSVLQRRFRKLLNRTVLDEITDVRIHKAIDLLRRSDLSVDEVSYKCGFGYAQNMGRIFRKHLNKSPKHYRSRLVK
jgi:LacI family transcriptional regulator